MTITRALAELKLLEKRIEKKIKECNFVDAINKMRKYTIFTNIPEDDFNKNTKSDYDSVRDLIKQRKKIKEAVILSNAKTIITICKQEMTVAEAIDKKTSIQFDKSLLAKLKNDLVKVQKTLEENNTKIENGIMDMLQQNLSKDRIANKDDYEKIAAPLKDDHQLKYVNPIDIEEKIKELEVFIDSFDNEIDFVLSESNAKTEINI